jgi:hypothetical protein
MDKLVALLVPVTVWQASGSVPATRLAARLRRKAETDA